MAADPRQGAAPLGKVHGRGVVRAPGAVVGHPRHIEARGCKRFLFRLQEGEALFDPLTGVKPGKPPRDDTRDHGRREFARCGQLPAAEGQLPLAFVVVLADHVRPYVLTPVIELLLQLVLDQLALLLDDEDLFEPLGELTHAFSVERPVHADLVDPQADLSRELPVNAEGVQSLPHVEVRLPRRDDPKARLRTVHDKLVELVEPRVRHGGVDFVPLQPEFLFKGRIGPPDVQPTGRDREVLGQQDIDAVGIHIHRRRAFDRVGCRFQRDPAPAVARHRPAMDAEIQVLLHASRVEDRHHRRSEHVFALVRDRR